MRDPERRMPRHLPLTVAAGLMAAAVLVWVLVTHWLAFLAIVAAAGLVWLLLRHGDRLTVAWWPSRRLPASTTGQEPPGTPETAQPERDPWL